MEPQQIVYVLHPDQLTVFGIFAALVVCLLSVIAVNGWHR